MRIAAFDAWRPLGKAVVHSPPQGVQDAVHASPVPCLGPSVAPVQPVRGQTRAVLVRRQVGVRGTTPRVGHARCGSPWLCNVAVRGAGGGGTARLPRPVGLPGPRTAGRRATPPFCPRRASGAPLGLGTAAILPLRSAQRAGCRLDAPAGACPLCRHGAAERQAAVCARPVAWRPDPCRAAAVPQAGLARIRAQRRIAARRFALAGAVPWRRRAL